jgi:hypothetical protein
VRAIQSIFVLPLTSRPVPWRAECAPACFINRPVSWRAECAHLPVSWWRSGRKSEVAQHAAAAPAALGHGGRGGASLPDASPCDTAGGWRVVARSSANGTITISFTSVVNNAMINGIEIYKAG